MDCLGKNGGQENSKIFTVDEINTSLESGSSQAKEELIRELLPTSVLKEIFDETISFNEVEEYLSILNSHEKTRGIFDVFDRKKNEKFESSLCRGPKMLKILNESRFQSLQYAIDGLSDHVKGMIFHIIGKTDLTISFYRKAADEGNLNALLKLGILYENLGKVDESKTCIYNAAERGNPIAMNIVGCALCYGGKSNEGIPWLERAANAGDYASFFNLGMIYTDLGNVAKAIDSYQKAIQKGINQNRVAAMNNLGLLLSEQKRNKEAFDVYKQGAMEGSGSCLHSAMVLSGRLTNDRSKERKGEDADINNFFDLPTFYFNEFDFKGFYRDNFEIISRKQEEWHAKIILVLTRFDIDNFNPLNIIRYPLLKLDMMRYKLMARYGDLKAALILGNLYYSTKEEEKAEDMYRILLERGYCDGINNLGVLLMDQSREISGQYEEYKLELAEEAKRMFYEAGMEGNNGNAMFHLGKLCLDEELRKYCGERRFVDIPNIKIIDYFLVHGTSEGKKVYKYIRLRLIEIEIFLRKSAKLGNVKAMHKLGILFARQLNNYKEAEFWLKKASETGSVQAFRDLCELLYKLGRKRNEIITHIMPFIKDEKNLSKNKSDLGEIINEYYFSDKFKNNDGDEFGLPEEIGKVFPDLFPFSDLFSGKY